MKKTILFLLFVITALSVNAQSGDQLKKFCARHHATDDVQEMSIPKFLLKLSADDPDLRKALRYMKSLKLFQLEGLHERREAICDELKEALKTDGFESILQVNNEGERINIYICQDENFIRKFLIAIDSKEELVLLHAKTKIRFDQLSEMISGFNTGKDSSGLKKMLGRKA